MSSWTVQRLYTDWLRNDKVVASENASKLGSCEWKYSELKRN